MNKRNLKQEIRAIHKALTPELRTPYWHERVAGSERPHPLAGHCYVAAEVLYHRLGGKEAGWTPATLSHETFPEGLAAGESHWFLRHESGIIADPTAAQFGDQEIPYEKGRGIGFLTKEPSRRAQIVMERMEAAEKSTQRAA